MANEETKDVVVADTQIGDVKDYFTDSAIKKDVGDFDDIKKSLVNIGVNGLKRLARICEESDTHRPYEVLSLLIERIGNVSEKGILKHKTLAEVERIKQQMIVKDPISDASSSSFNIMGDARVFIGSANDVAKALKDKREQEDDGARNIS